MKDFDLLDTSLKPGDHLIEASAGTGKTYNIAGLFVRLILEENLEAGQILTVTYTEAATRELRARILARLNDALRAITENESGGDKFLERLLGRVESGELPRQAAQLQLRLAIAEFDNSPIHTIHGFCQRMLSDWAFLCGEPLEVEVVTDETELLTRVARDFWRNTFYEGDSLLVASALKGGIELNSRRGGKRKNGPEALISLVRPFLSHPRLKEVSPKTARKLPEAGEALRERFQVVQQNWSECREEIRALLEGCSGFKKSFIDQIPYLLGAMEQLTAGQVSVEALQCIDALTPGNISGEMDKRRKAAVAPGHRFFAHCESFREALVVFAYSLRVAFIQHARQRLDELKRRQGTQGFSDMLVRLEEALHSDAGQRLADRIREKYHAALIDEFQDTDAIQCRIFETLFMGGQASVFLIGDPKQSIFGFRGADVFSYLVAREKVPPGSRFTLKQNYRSTPGYVDAVNRVFGRRSAPFYFSQIEFKPSNAADRPNRPTLGSNENGKNGGALRLWRWTREDKPIPSAVASEIVALLESGETFREPGRPDRPIAPEDIAVLVRKNWEAKGMKLALSAVGVPSVMKTTESVFASREAEELERVLGAIASPFNPGALRTALATDVLGQNGNQIHAMTEDEDEIVRQVETLSGLRTQYSRDGFLQVFRRFCEHFNFGKNLLRFADGERRMTNLLQLGELLHDAATTHQLGLVALIRWLARQRQEADTDMENLLRLESDENAVRIVTIHKSKGLEYPIVFLPYSAKRRKPEEVGFLFHPKEDRGQLCLEMGSEDCEQNQALAIREGLSEELRLLYVALTRPIHRCYLLSRDPDCSADERLQAPALEWLNHPGPGATAEDELDALEALARDSCGTIEVCPSPEPNLVPWKKPVEGNSQPLRDRCPTRVLWPSWQVSSFSSLVSGTEFAEHHNLPDHADDPRSVALESELPPVGEDELKRGPKPGICLHKIMEALDFTKHDSADSISSIKNTAEHHGLGGSVSVIRKMIGNALDAPIIEGEPGFRLGGLSREDRLDEVEFDYATGIKPGRFADLFRMQGGEAAQLYASRLERLAGTATKGFMHGFIDMVFRYRGRYWILDWKTNHLGSQGSHYEGEPLANAMRASHYVLQYHIYTTALHRFLAHRLEGYDYEKRFGGVLYLFLRGIDPGRPGRGIFHDRPTLQLIDALSETAAQSNPSAR